MILEERWRIRYNEVIGIRKKDHSKLSKYYLEEKLMFHFIHHNKKLYNGGFLNVESVEAFERLLTLYKEYKSV